ncbi:MAG: amidohydrolase family protein [Phycisphaerales bacterium]
MLFSSQSLCSADPRPSAKIRGKALPAFLRALCASAVIASPAFAQDLAKRPPAQEMPIAIVHATIHPIAGDEIKDGYIQFDKGKIVEIGSMEGGRMFAATIRQIDAKGKHVYPGLISPITQLGLEEIASVRASNDFNEAGNITPEVTPAVSVNPDSTLLPVTRTNGVLIAGIFPKGGVLPGRVSVIQLDGWTSEDMTIKRDCGQLIAWPLTRTVRAPWMDRSDEDQQRDIRQSLDRIRDAFRSAKAYIDLKAAEPTTPTDLRWEAMRDVLAGKLPVFIEAQDFDQITASLMFAQEFKLRPVIVGGRDAPLCAELLKKLDAPVIVTGTYRVTPRRDDSGYDEQFSLPARLKAAGIRFAIASGEETPHERNLPYSAALAAAHGLTPAEALRAITLDAATILGIDSRVGSLEKGKDATIIITDGDPLEVSTVVSQAFIQGRAIDLGNKQSALAEKYREKYRQQPKNEPRTK